MAKKEDVREKEKEVIKKLDQNYPKVSSRKNTFPSSFMWFLAGLSSLCIVELKASVLGWLVCVCVCVCVVLFFFGEDIDEISRTGGSL